MNIGPHLKNRQWCRMARISVGFVLLLGLSAFPCQAEDQNAAAVNRGDSPIVIEPKYKRIQSIEDLIQVAEQLEQKADVLI